MATSLNGPADEKAVQAARSGRSTRTTQRRSFANFEEKRRLVENIFSLNTAEPCEDVLLCDLFLRQAEASQPALADLIGGCERLVGLTTSPHLHCDWLLTA